MNYTTRDNKLTTNKQQQTDNNQNEILSACNFRLRTNLSKLSSLQLHLTMVNANGITLKRIVTKLRVQYEASKLSYDRKALAPCNA